ncbi:MAG: hypothetical protein PHD81_02130 [Candidatus Nanoarchaeia archaeon]|nr:hypothetical protein [Candidatus Nanoarchaeia archaeon]MDD5587888.1 hypothetical protein [Candidatus Nanoarchaeia archaeon]
MSVASTFQSLQAMGVYEYLLPFLLVFSIVFALLEKLKILGKDKEENPKTNINVVVSLVMGALLIAQPQIVYLINQFLPKVSLLIIVALMFLMVAGMFGTPTEDWGGIALVVALIISILGIIWALSPSAGLYMPTWFHPTDEDKAWVILIGTIVVVVAMFSRKEAKTPKSLKDYIFK